MPHLVLPFWKSPVRPQLALRVGITGHRWREPHHASQERLGRDDAPAVREALRTVLTRIRQAVQSHQRQQWRDL